LSFWQNVGAIALTALLAAVGWLYRHERERRMEVERQLSERKYDAYIQLLNVFFDTFKASRGGRRPQGADLLNRMVDANKDLMLYGSEEVVRLYHAWLLEMRTGTVHLAGLGELMVAIRRDMGNRKTRVTSEDVLRQLITDYDQARARGELTVHIQDRS
jgi:hypothetical protein